MSGVYLFLTTNDAGAYASTGGGGAGAVQQVRPTPTLICGRAPTGAPGTPPLRDVPAPAALLPPLHALPPKQFWEERVGEEMRRQLEPKWRHHAVGEWAFLCART